MIDFFVKYSPVIGLIFFFVVFCGVAFYTLRPRNKKKLQEHANIPLKD